MGRFGNLMLVNGETVFNLPVRQEEVVRLYLTNTANVRDFKLELPGAKMKLVGGDNGRVEREEFAEASSCPPSGSSSTQCGSSPDIRSNTMPQEDLSIGQRNGLGTASRTDLFVGFLQLGTTRPEPQSRIHKRLHASRIRSSS
jgi:hypothetical protein